MKKLMVFLTVLIIGIVIGGGAGYYHISNNTAVTDPLDSNGLETRTYHTEVITVNIGKNILKASFSLVGDSEKTAIELAKRDFQIKQFIVTSASKKNKSAFMSSEGIKQFQDEIKNYMNEQMKDGEVVEVYVNNKLVAMN